MNDEGIVCVICGGRYIPGIHSGVGGDYRFRYSPHKLTSSI